MKRPTHIFDLLELSLSSGGIEAHSRNSTMLSYEFNYESGLCLLAIFADREHEGWFRTTRQLVLMIFDIHQHEKDAPPVMQESMPFPGRPNDLAFCRRATAKLIAMAQTTADLRGGGQSLSYAMAPKGRPSA